MGSARWAPVLIIVILFIITPRNTRKQGRRQPKRRQNRTRRSRGAAGTAKGPGAQHATPMNSLLYVARTTPLFPPTKRQPNLRYYDFAQQLAAAAGFTASRFFIANGMFDPDISGTGHQPMGFDQMMAVYTTYHVIRATITVTALPEAAGCALGLYLSPDTTAITDPIRLIENGLMRVIHLGTNVADGGQRLGSISLSVDVPRYFGRSRDIRSMLNDDNLGGTSAANPFEGVYFGICAFCFYSSAAVTIDYDVMLTYDAIFSEPRKLTVS
jgi:hypothetical protein